MLETIGAAKSIWGKGSAFPGDVDDAYEWVVNAPKDVLELVDELRRVKKEDGDEFENGNVKVSLHIGMIKKPQYAYNMVVDNSNQPFEHVLLDKSDDDQRFIHPLTKWCPSPCCEYAVTFDAGNGSYDVSCLCSYSFCWNRRLTVQ